MYGATGMTGGMTEAVRDAAQRAHGALPKSFLLPPAAVRGATATSEVPRTVRVDMRAPDHGLHPQAKKLDLSGLIGSVHASLGPQPVSLGLENGPEVVGLLAAMLFVLARGRVAVLIQWVMDGADRLYVRATLLRG